MDFSCQIYEYKYVTGVENLSRAWHIMQKICNKHTCLLLSVTFSATMVKKGNILKNNIWKNLHVKLSHFLKHITDQLCK